MTAARRASFQPSGPVTNACTGDDGLAAFMAVRPRLFGIAYRMLRSASDAEDVVQDAWIRWQTADRSIVRDAVGFLATTTTRLAINVMRSARCRRETCAGRWLPEPVEEGADPRVETERSQALASGVLLLLERLAPTERAAYILREALDYPYREIAKVLQLQEANARQVVVRARQHLASSRRVSTSSTGVRHLLEVVTATLQTGDVAGLEEALGAGRRRAATQRRSTIARPDRMSLPKARRRRDAA